MNGDALDCLQDLPAESVDALVTDPPAGIAFMGKEWDHHKGGRDEWVKWLTEIMRECYRVMKPGAHGFVWALPRTSHWTAWALEEAGFEIRDSVHHLFGSGFPKSLDVSKAIDKAAGAEREVVGPKVFGGGHLASKVRQKKPGTQHDGWERPWQNDQSKIDRINSETAPASPAAKRWSGWGTALKPAHEVWWLVRKPLSEKTVAKNVLKHGTGALNIDASRVEGKPRTTHKDGNFQSKTDKSGKIFDGLGLGYKCPEPQGRFPANLIVSGSARDALDEQSGELVSKWGKQKTKHGGDKSMFGVAVPSDVNRYSGDSGGASRFFFDGADPFLYCAKESKKGRGEGNNHPTVKAQRLMRYLCKMITPPDGTVLDPFMGSGSTGVACAHEGFKFIGIDAEKEYVEIARARIEAG